jgi:hypothetical protein
MSTPSSGSFTNSGDADNLTTEKPFRVGRWVCPASQPHYFRWGAQGGGEVIEIEIRTYDNESVRLGEIPDLAIRAGHQVNANHMSSSGVQVGESLNQFAGQVLIKEQLHKATRRPILAANS